MKFPLIGWRAVTYSGPCTRRNCQGLGVILKNKFSFSNTQICSIELYSRHLFGRFLIKAYVRARLSKIEKFVWHYTGPNASNLTEVRKQRFHIGKGSKKNRFFLGKSPKQRTPPTHHHGLGLT